jgi:hypothetical protein
MKVAVCLGPDLRVRSCSFNWSSAAALITLTAIVAALSWWVLGGLFGAHPWLGGPRQPHGPKLTVMLCLVAMVWSVAMMTACGLDLGARSSGHLEIFSTYEASVYFSLVVFTTLGYGDVLLAAVEWRLLGGLAAANGLVGVRSVDGDAGGNASARRGLRQRGRFQ